MNIDLIAVIVFVTCNLAFLVAAIVFAVKNRMGLADGGWLFMVSLVLWFSGP